MSYKGEVLVQGQWSTNALRFPTEEQALGYARDLHARWTLCVDYRATECEDEANHTWTDETRTLTEIDTGKGHSPAWRVQL